MGGIRIAGIDFGAAVDAIDSDLEEAEGVDGTPCRVTGDIVGVIFATWSAVGPDLGEGVGETGNSCFCTHDFLPKFGVAL